MAAVLEWVKRRRDPGEPAERHTLAKIVTFFVFIFLGAPVFIAVISSFSPTALLQFPPKDFSLKWYQNIFEVGNFVDAFFNSLAIAAGATVIDIAAGVLAGLAVTRRAFKGSGALAAFFTSPMYLPGVMLGFVLLQVFALTRGVSVFNKILIAHCVIILPYIVRNVVSVLQSFDWTLEEAAASLGANSFQVFTRVTVPLIRPGIAAGALLAFLFSLDDATLSAFLTGPRFVTLPVRVMTYMEFAFDPTLAAISTVMIAVSLVIILILERLVGLNMLLDTSKTHS